MCKKFDIVARSTVLVVISCTSKFHNDVKFSSFQTGPSTSSTSTTSRAALATPLYNPRTFSRKRATKDADGGYTKQSPPVGAMPTLTRAPTWPLPVPGNMKVFGHSLSRRNTAVKPSAFRGLNVVLLASGASLWLQPALDLLRQQNTTDSTRCVLALDAKWAQLVYLQRSMVEQPATSAAAPAVEVFEFSSDHPTASGRSDVFRSVRASVQQRAKRGRCSTVQCLLPQVYLPNELALAELPYELSLIELAQLIVDATPQHQSTVLMSSLACTYTCGAAGIYNAYTKQHVCLSIIHHLQDLLFLVQTVPWVQGIIFEISVKGHRNLRLLATFCKEAGLTFHQRANAQAWGATQNRVRCLITTAGMTLPDKGFRVAPSLRLTAGMVMLLRHHQFSVQSNYGYSKSRDRRNTLHPARGKRVPSGTANGASLRFYVDSTLRRVVLDPIETASVIQSIPPAYAEAAFRESGEEAWQTSEAEKKAASTKGIALLVAVNLLSAALRFLCPNIALTNNWTGKGEYIRVRGANAVRNNWRCVKSTVAHADATFFAKRLQNVYTRTVRIFRGGPSARKAELERRSQAQ